MSSMRVEMGLCTVKSKLLHQRLHYRNQLLCRVSEASDKAWKTFSEGSDTRQRKLGELYIGNGFFAEYFLSSKCQQILGKEKSPS
jgi:hypothetical protein